jgi:CubicO group peptidase (beta-lactamase class C family)/D-alanyl-D-alanine dipeptidase
MIVAVGRAARRVRCGITVLRLLAIVGALTGGRVLPSAAAQAVVGPADRYAELARRLEPWIAQELAAKGLPAISVALVDDQELVWARGFGFADAEKRVPATADMLCRVGSVSKVFTALAVMQQVERGKLGLDAPVGAILDEFQPRNLSRVPITLRHLLSHRAGLVREPPRGHYFDANIDVEARLLLEVVRSMSATAVLFEPGTRTKYSNAGVTVAGAVLEQIAGEPFASCVARSVLRPLAMMRSRFEPSPELMRKLAHGEMWTYDGQSIATPRFSLGTAPAGDLVSTAVDLSRLLSCLFAEGRYPGGAIVKPETLRQMWEPQGAKTGEPSPFGLGFALSTFEGERRVGHGGAVYGYATSLEALPDAKLGAITIVTADCANGAAGRISEAALRMMLSVRRGRPLPALKSTGSLALERARQLDGHYVHGDRSVDLVERGGKVFLSPFADGMRVEVRGLGDTLVVDDKLVSGPTIGVDGTRITVGGETYEKTNNPKPPACQTKWEGLIGEYGWDHNVLYVLEKAGRLHVLIEWFFDYPLTEEQPDQFNFPDEGLYRGEKLVFRRGAAGGEAAVGLGRIIFKRRALDGEGGKTYRIKPRRPIEEIRTAIRGAKPPVEQGQFRKPALVELVRLDPTIKLDIRYATSNNFLGVPVYTTARALLQRPAAEALVRVHRRLEKDGYGLLVHDAYRPWEITKLFWEATPDEGRIFVADPAKGSKHNRGCAVDLTLYERSTGQPVQMVGGYDEFSPRSYPDYPGGTSLQRWHRELLRRVMEAERFTVNEFEWWHFDYRDWAQYPIMNLELRTAGDGASKAES